MKLETFPDIILNKRPQIHGWTVFELETFTKFSYKKGLKFMAYGGVVSPKSDRSKSTSTKPPSQ